LGEELEGGEGGGYEVPDCIQGEVAKMPIGICINLDPLHHPGSKDILLICKMGLLLILIIPSLGV